MREAEEDALSVALGFAPTKRDDGDGTGTGTGANGIKVENKEIEEAEKEERRLEKEYVHISRVVLMVG